MDIDKQIADVVAQFKAVSKQVGTSGVMNADRTVIDKMDALFTKLNMLQELKEQGGGAKKSVTKKTAPKKAAPKKAAPKKAAPKKVAPKKA